MDFKDILIQKYKFTNADWDCTIKYFIPETIDANKHFLEFGNISDRIGLVKCGLLRSYNMDPNDNEITTHFYLSGSVVISIDSFNNQVKADESIVAIEESEIISISYQNLQKLYEKVPSWQQICKDVTEIKNKELIARTVQFQTLSASQRYQTFCKQFPEVVKKVALKHIASYLGIDIATLSRIRKIK